MRRPPKPLIPAAVAGIGVVLMLLFDGGPLLAIGVVLLLAGVATEPRCLPAVVEAD